MLFHFDRRKKSEKEKKPPRFLVLRRKWLTLGAAVLAAVLVGRHCAGNAKNLQQPKKSAGVLSALAGVLLVIACVGFFVLLKTTKTGLVPNEDMGTVFVDVRTSPGNSIYETRKVIEQVDSCLRTIPQIEVLSSITGNSMLSGQGACNGMFTIRLKDWSERPKKEDAVDAIIEEIQRRTAFISSADIMAFTRPMIPGYGVSSGFEVYVQDQKGGTAPSMALESVAASPTPMFTTIFSNLGIIMTFSYWNLS